MSFLPHDRPQAHAFSLIEVLIAVLVLGLGLLGLAAVFPVVIDAQRTASDRSQAVSVGDSMVSSVLRHRGLNYVSSTNPSDIRGLRAWQRDLTWSRESQWMLPDDSGAFTLDGNDGRLTIQGFGSGRDVEIPVAERLFPAPFTRGVEPRFVWDIVARRIPQGVNPSTGWQSEPTPSDPIELAIFVRRVETGIRVPDRLRSVVADRAKLGTRVRLSDVLVHTNEVRDVERRVPVGTRPDGRAAGDGRPGYAQPFEVTIAPTPIYGSSPGQLPEDYLAIRSPTAAFRIAASQIGQKLLDSRGNVYTVRAIDDSIPAGSDVVIVQVDRPVASWIRNPPSPRDPTLHDTLICTPQVAVGIRVVRITP